MMIRFLRLLTVAVLLTGCGESEPPPREVYKRPAPTASAVPAAPSVAPVDGHVVTFEGASRDGASSLGTLIWSAPGSATSGFRQETEERVELPFSTTVTFDGALPELTLWVQNNGAEAEMICRIRVDGQLVLENSSSGLMGALCSLPSAV